jgi:hypothetical protein
MLLTLNTLLASTNSSSGISETGNFAELKKGRQTRRKRDTITGIEKYLPMRFFIN